MDPVTLADHGDLREVAWHFSDLALDIAEEVVGVARGGEDQHARRFV